MDPLAPKPFGGNKPAFKAFQRRAVPEKSQTLPAGMPALSGDILKQRLKTLHDKSNGTKPELPRSSGSIGKGSPKHSVPVFSQKEITNRRDSMHKAPPPPPPDSKKTFEKTPEFLRKKLKPTGKVLSKEESEEKSATNQVNSETEEKLVEQNINGKSNFRKSLLMFEQTPPTIAPKPRARSKLSNELSEAKKENLNENQEITEKQKEVNSENLKGTADAAVCETAPACETVSVDNTKLTDVENIAQQSDSSNNNDIDNDTKGKDDQNSDQWPKPQNIDLPNIPDGLSEWMNRYVKNNKNLIKLDSEQQNVPPVVLRELKNAPPVLNKNSSDDVKKEGNEDDGEIYDDVQTGTTENEELYDDVDAAKQTGVVHSSDIQSDNAAATTEEVYDDVNIAAPIVQEELYDDVEANAQPGGEEFYDDVQQQLASGTFNEFADDEIEGESGEALYEPVETIAAYVASGSTNKPEAVKSDSLQSNHHPDKVNKKKEEKDRKEREKLEKKRREEAEKKLKKEEEERKKKEKEDRKRIEKERKLFNLKPDEDPVPIERHMAKCEIRAKGKDLSFCRGEYLDIISKNNCPKGKVLAQNNLLKLGYVSLKDLGIDKRKSLLETSSPVAPGVAFGDEFYEKVNSQSEGLIVSLSSPRADESPVFQSNLSHFKQSAHSSPSSNRGDGRETDEGNPGEEIYELVS